MGDLYDDQELKRLKNRRKKDEEFRKRMREEIIRVSSGDAQEDIERDKAEHEAKEQQRIEREKSEKRREANPVWLIISGNVLLHDHVRKGYRYMGILAILFFLGIVTMFASLHLDLHYGKLSSQLLILRERSLKMQSERFSKSSHSEISRQLKERNIEIYDPTKPRIIIE